MSLWLQKPRWWVFSILWLLWAMAACGHLFAIRLYAAWDRPRILGGLPNLFEPSILIYTLIVGLVLGAIQFLMWKRGLWGRRRRAMQIVVTSLALLILVASIFLGGFVRQQNYRAAGMFGPYTMEDYERLATAGRYDEMVEMMEEDCAYFNKAKLKVGEDMYVRSCNHGFSHLFVELYYVWDSVIRLAPYSVLAVLENARYDRSGRNDHLGGYGPYRPLAERVRESDTLILKALACFMLDDMEGFAETAHALAEEDEDAIPLAGHASHRLQKLRGE